MSADRLPPKTQLLAESFRHQVITANAAALERRAALNPRPARPGVAETTRLEAHAYAAIPTRPLLAYRTFQEAHAVAIGHGITPPDLEPFLAALVRNAQAGQEQVLKGATLEVYRALVFLALRAGVQRDYSPLTAEVRFALPQDHLAAKLWAEEWEPITQPFELDEAGEPLVNPDTKRAVLTAETQRVLERHRKRLRYALTRLEGMGLVSYGGWVGERTTAEGENLEGYATTVYNVLIRPGRVRKLHKADYESENFRDLGRDVGAKNTLSGFFSQLLNRQVKATSQLQRLKTQALVSNPKPFTVNSWEKTPEGFERLAVEVRNQIQDVKNAEPEHRHRFVSAVSYQLERWFDPDGNPETGQDVRGMYAKLLHQALIQLDRGDDPFDQLQGVFAGLLEAMRPDLNEKPVHTPGAFIVWSLKKCGLWARLGMSGGDA